MAKRRAAVRQLRVDKKRRLRNLKIKNTIKTSIKKFQALLAAKNLAEAKTILSKIYSMLDKAAKKNIIHPNTANRRKFRLARKLGKTA